MRALVLFLFLLMLSFHPMAHSQEVISKEMRNLEINLMLENFADLGWLEYADVAAFPQGVLMFDQVFIKEDSDDLVMLKFVGPTTDSKPKFEKILTEQGVILNFTTRWGNLASMYIESHDEASIAKIETSLGLKKTSRWELLIPRAHAASAPHCSPRSKNAFAVQAAMAESCFWNFGGAFKDDVIGKGNTIWENIKNPKSLKHYWNEAKKQLNGIKTAILEIQKSIPQFIDTVLAFALSVQTDAICAWVGGLMPDILIGVAIGAGVAKLTIKITQSLTKMKELGVLLKGMKRMENVIPEKAQSELLTGAIRCAM